MHRAPIQLVWLKRDVRLNDLRLISEGFPQFLGYDLCQQILKILTSTEQYTYLEDQSRVVLNEDREKLGRFLKAVRGGINGDSH